jgi:hypothetical protein
VCEGGGGWTTGACAPYATHCLPAGVEQAAVAAFRADVSAANKGDAEAARRCYNSHGAAGGVHALDEGSRLEVLHSLHLSLDDYNRMVRGPCVCVCECECVFVFCIVFVRVCALCRGVRAGDGGVCLGRKREGGEGSLT